MTDLESQLTAALARAENAERAADWFAGEYKCVSEAEFSYNPPEVAAWLERREEPK